MAYNPEMALKAPTRLYLPADGEEVKRFLTFHDRSVDFALRKAKANFRWRGSDPEAYDERIAELTAQQKRCVLFYDEDSLPYTYPGLRKDLENRFGWTFRDDVGPSQGDPVIPWAATPHEMRPYQAAAVEALIAARHGAVSLPTGSGKSLCLLYLVKRMPYQTVIVAPLASIARQLYDEFQRCLGKRYVGLYGDGKKDVGKRITVAVAQSLAKVEEGTDAWEFFQKTESLIYDEAHTSPADTFESVCVNLLGNARNRWFVSATHVRADGSEMVLRGITGPIVYSKEYAELVAEGYLAPLTFKTFRVPVIQPPVQGDAKKETRRNLYLNPNVNRVAADIASKAVSLAGRQVVIIVEEFKQFLQLRNFMAVPYEFVHGGVAGENRDIVPREYWDVDAQKVVREFNEGKIRCIIGTSAIATGVDLKPTACLIYLQGGLSDVKVKQSIGRGTRTVPGKKDCWVIDFSVTGSPLLERHFKERTKIYSEFGSVETLW